MVTQANTNQEVVKWPTSWEEFDISVAKGLFNHASMRVARQRELDEQDSEDYRRRMGYIRNPSVSYADAADVLYSVMMNRVLGCIDAGTYYQFDGYLILRGSNHRLRSIAALVGKRMVSMGFVVAIYEWSFDDDIGIRMFCRGWKDDDDGVIRLFGDFENHIVSQIEF